MNAEVEREIVQNFVQKRSKERLRWELSSPKKRLGGMSKINKREYLDERKIYKIPHWSIDALMKQIFLLGGTRRTYYLSLDSYCQTDDFPKEMDICDAISMARQEIGGCILYFGNGIGYYHEGEPYDTHQEYILSARPIKPFVK